MSDRKTSESGVLVYPQMPVPKQQRESAPKIKKKPGSGRGKTAAVLGAAAIAGVIGGFLLRPLIAPDARVTALNAQLQGAKLDAATERDTQAKQIAQLQADKQAAETKLADAQQAQTLLATKAAEAEAKIKEADAVQAKLKAAVDKSVGTISANGDEITLQLVDRVLFKLGDDQLTEGGKKVLDRVAGALKELPDKQIWVHGHTDDQPIYIAPKPPAPPPAPKGKKKAPAPPPPAVVKAGREPDGRFATNWELSAARALTVVHYLQDTHKLDGSRLAALAFGQYRPISKNKAVNRRIEIVLYPKPVVKK